MQPLDTSRTTALATAELVSAASKAWSAANRRVAAHRSEQSERVALLAATIADLSDELLVAAEALVEADQLAADDAATFARSAA